MLLTHDSSISLPPGKPQQKRYLSLPLLRHIHFSGNEEMNKQESREQDTVHKS